MQDQADDNLFQLYEGAYTPGPGRPTVVVAADSAVPPNVYGECFVFIEAPLPQYYERRLKCAAPKDPGDLPVAVDLEFMAGNALVQANNYLSEYLNSYHQQSEQRVWASQYSLQQANSASLVRLWMRGHFREQLTRVSQISKSTLLRTFLGQCKQLPIVQHDDLSD